MNKQYIYELWYENQDKYFYPFLIQTTLSKLQMNKIVDEMRERINQNDDTRDTEIIKELALKLDPTYKEIQIDGSIEY